MTAEMEAAILEEVARIEKEMQPEEFLTELRAHTTVSVNEYSTPVCDGKLRDFAVGLLDKVVPALESASPAEAWTISREARTAFRAKSDSLREERSLEFDALERARAPWP